MERRSFIKTTSLLAAGATVASTAGCKNENKYSKNEPVYYKDERPVTILKALENDFLKVSLFSDASAKILDKKNNYEWELTSVATQDCGPIDDGYVWIRGDRTLMEQYPGRFHVEADGNTFHYTLLGKNNRIKATFHCSITLEDKFLNFSISDIDESIPSLIFPPHIESDSIVLPNGLGKIFHKKNADIWTRQFYNYQTGLNMRWFGGLKDGYGWLAIFDDHINDGGVLQVNNSLAPGWLKSMDKWKSAYSIKYNFMKGSYVELAKTYRKHLIENGLFKTLKEKIIENPLLENMIGGRSLSYFQAWCPIHIKDAKNYLYNDKQIHQRDTEKIKVDFTHQEVLKSLRYAQKTGFKNGMVILRGWINQGYDGNHPDIWPPEPLLGSIDDLKEIMSLPAPIIPTLHDQYQDVYIDTKEFPKGVNRLPDGDLMHGGLWAGGQGYIMNSRFSVYFAKRNWENTKTLTPKGLFLDTVTASKFHQSWEEKNLQTRTEDMQYKTKLLQDHKSYGILIGSEEGSEMGIPVCDWFENRHTRKDNENIPLFPLVFHDAVIMSRYNSFEPGSSTPKWMEDMLWGYQLQFFMNPQFGNIRPAEGGEKIGFGPNMMTEELFKSTFVVDEWHKKIALSEMTDHKFLTEDGKVEETTFAPGIRIIVNFSNETRTVNGIEVKANNYVIKA